MGQVYRFTAATGAQLRDRGIDQVLRHERAEWKAAYWQIVRLMRDGAVVTGDSLRRDYLYTLPRPHSPNVYGAMFNAAIKRGYFERVHLMMGRIEDPRGHARETPLYQRTAKR